MNETTGQYSSSGGDHGFPMRVALMSPRGSMQTLWLPAKAEGMYRFQPGLDPANPSLLQLRAENGCWCAVLGGGAFFFTYEVGMGGYAVERRIGSSVELTDRALFHIRFGDSVFVLYTEAENEESNVFHHFYIEKSYPIRIGRSQDCDICYSNRLVSREHASLHWDGRTWVIRDLNSRNGVYLNGKMVKEAPVGLGDVIYIMGLRILMGVGFISLNDGNNRVRITSPRLRRIRQETDAEFSRSTIRPNTEELFKRQPRHRLPLVIEPIEIEMPPMKLGGSNIPLLLRMGSPAVMGGRAIMSGNIAMALTSMVFPLLTNGYSEKDRKDYENRRKEKYREYLKKKEEQIRAEQYRELDVLSRTYPDFPQILQILDSRERLWERKKIDDDFLKLRIGHGRLPMLAQREYEPKKFGIEEDELEDEMYALAEKPFFLENAPIMLSLVEDRLVAVGGNREQSMAFLQMLLTRLVFLHSYDEVKLVILANEQDLGRFEAFRYLPHCWNDEMDMRFIASTKADAGRIGEFLRNLLEEELEKEAKLKDLLKLRPYYVVVATDKSLFDTVEVFKQVLIRDENPGVSLITCFEGNPIECTKLVEMSEQYGVVMDQRNPENVDQSFVLDNMNLPELNRRARTLAHIRQRNLSQSFSLPKMITFLAMFDAGRVEHLNPLKRWAENNPVKSLGVPVGVGTDGELLYLDLHEKFQGPHGLVAGTTGSGKSEFIITYILSMAVNFNPDEVAFILIDYKGGGLTGAFEDERRGIHLPHLVGTITNLDGAAIQRSLMSINSELKRRQALFNEAKSRNNEGTMDIYGYQKLYREKKVDEPIPHLFIISDEFAELKAQQPEFMDELISTARIGRSLGVHLILATQKPAGVVNDQIWSNTKFRVCLKVASKADSNDMLKRPEAAELKDTGRFYLQVGYNEYFALGQSAWCGAGYEPQDEVIVTVDQSVQFLDPTGQTVAKAQPLVKKEKSKTKQIVAVVQYLSDLAKRERLQARKLWLEPLSSKIDADELMAKYDPVGGSGIRALMGMVDDPQHQSQFPLYLDVQNCRNYAVIGESGCGKSNFLRTLLYVLSSQFSPEQLNYYILDYSGGVLAPFRVSPHCGAYLTEKDENDVDRLLEMLRGVIEERKKLFSDAGVANFNSYVQTNRLPLMLLVIDNFAGLTSLPKGPDYLSGIHKFFRDAAPYGILTFVATSHLNELSSRSKQEIQDRIGLHLNDRYGYFELLNLKAEYVPPDVPGRGLCVADERVLEYQTAQFAAQSSDQEQAVLLRERLQQIAREKGYRPCSHILSMMDPEESYESFCRDIAPERIPLGYSEDVRKISLPLQQMLRMSLYFGNPSGVAPVLRNLLYAADRDNMKVLVIKRVSESLFSGANALRCRDMEVLDCSEESSMTLVKRMMQEILSRKIYRDQFCQMNGLSPQGPNTMRRAASYIRQHTQPLLVLFESFVDFSKSAADACLKNMPDLLEKTQGYNFYFVGCFDPGDSERITIDRMSQVFNKEPLAMFFGGQLNKQGITMLPAQYRGIDKPDPAYNKALLLYKNAYHKIHMPCGVLEKDNTDPDERDIV